MPMFATFFVGVCILVSFLPLGLFLDYPASSSSSSSGRGTGRRPHIDSSSVEAAVGGLSMDLQNSPLMNQTQCTTEFPLLYPQLDANVAAWRRKGGVKHADIEAASKNCRHGCVHVLIVDGQIFIRNQVKDWQSRVRSVLHLLRTAVDGATPAEKRQLNNAELVISTADFDGFSAGNGSGWVLDKRVSDPAGQFLFPDFSFASWPEAGIPSYQEFRRSAAKVNEQVPWASKANKAFWRGDALANSNIAARNSLLSVATGAQARGWSDVKRTSFWESGPEIGEIVTPHDHCRHKFLVHAEGVAYSGRSKFILNCQSAVVMHALEWTQHFHPALIGDPDSPDQNIVQLQGDYFDQLPTTIQHLRDQDIQDPTTSLASRIAQNARRTLTHRYLTPASVSCYLRAALIDYNSLLDRDSWPNRKGPTLLPGSGVMPGAGTSKGTLKDLGVAGDIELSVWHNLGQPEWPPA
ncbi:hypothetical protein BCV70DRAFT_200290 [Testicularia cyperi]|uniref:Glycosyl transferase CAP10 domain-containing protein n=1 Tax=Testicularia cyperi TaxID=1882483 RepID=A0A317XQG0_9BASI|nr:hypothetical protein BCV70DRAFT_200290 [Testicularia cyperi]